MDALHKDKDKKGGKPATITRKRRKGSNKTIDATTRNHILLDVEAGMPVAKAAKAYNVHYTSIYILCLYRILSFFNCYYPF